MGGVVKTDIQGAERQQEITIEKPGPSARLARFLARSAYSPMRTWRLAMLAMLVLVTTICAVWRVIDRYQMSGNPPTLVQATDFLYAPFLYLVPQTSFENAAVLSLPEIIARITGPLIPALSLFWLLRQRLLVWSAQRLAAHGLSGHAVVFGKDGSADTLALESSIAGQVVVLIDPSVSDDEEREHRLGMAGVICLAAVPASLAMAGSIHVWQQSDTDNIASASALRTRHDLSVEEIDLLVSSTDLQAALLQSPDLMLDRRIRLRPHSLSGAAIRAALANPEAVELAIELGQPRVTLCLWGRSDALLWAAEIALQQFWSVRLGAPRILWAGTEAGSRLPESLEHLLCHAEGVFGKGDQCPQVSILPADAACCADDVTCHLVDAGDADATLAQAFALAAKLRQAHRQPAPVRPVLASGSGIAPLFASDKLVFLPPIIPGAGVTVAGLRNRWADQKAAEIHLAYDRQFGGDGAAPASGRWQDLPETYVAANRAAADHLAIKSWDAATSGMKGDALIEAMAQIEHNRWSAERLLARWAPAGNGARDNLRRLHPDLRPWDALGDGARQKDRDAVRKIIGANALAI